MEEGADPVLHLLCDHMDRCKVPCRNGVGQRSLDMLSTDIIVGVRGIESNVGRLQVDDLVGAVLRNALRCTVHERVVHELPWFPRGILCHAEVERATRIDVRLRHPLT